jgi:hypothetical protein
VIECVRKTTLLIETEKEGDIEGLVRKENKERERERERDIRTFKMP